MQSVLLLLKVEESRFPHGLRKIDHTIELLYLLKQKQHNKSNKREWYIFPRSTHWVETFCFSSNLFTDYQFKTSFRMTRDSFYQLHELLQPHIQRQKTRFRNPIPSEHRLAIFLYHISMGCSYHVIENQFACGKSTVSNIIGDVAQAILSHMSPQYIRFSTMAEAMRTMEYWRTKSKIPGVVACIDGSHIPISQPAGSGPSYFNRKSYYSLNVQGITFSHFG